MFSFIFQVNLRLCISDNYSVIDGVHVHKNTREYITYFLRLSQNRIRTFNLSSC